MVRQRQRKPRPSLVADLAHQCVVYSIPVMVQKKNPSCFIHSSAAVFLCKYIYIHIYICSIPVAPEYTYDTYMIKFGPLMGSQRAGLISYVSYICVALCCHHHSEYHQLSPCGCDAGKAKVCDYYQYDVVASQIR